MKKRIVAFTLALVVALLSAGCASSRRARVALGPETAVSVAEPLAPLPEVETVVDDTTNNDMEVLEESDADTDDIDEAEAIPAEAAEIVSVNESNENPAPIAVAPTEEITFTDLGEFEHHFVAPGETLSGILSDRRALGRMSEVVELNELVNPDLIFVGQAILVPVGVNVPTTNVDPAEPEVLEGDGEDESIVEEGATVSAEALPLLPDPVEVEPVLEPTPVLRSEPVGNSHLLESAEIPRVRVKKEATRPKGPSRFHYWWEKRAERETLGIILFLLGVATLGFFWTRGRWQVYKEEREAEVEALDPDVQQGIREGDALFKAQADVDDIGRELENTGVIPDASVAGPHGTLVFSPSNSGSNPEYEEKVKVFDRGFNDPLTSGNGKGNGRSRRPVDLEEGLTEAVGPDNGDPAPPYLRS